MDEQQQQQQQQRTGERTNAPVPTNSNSNTSSTTLPVVAGSLRIEKPGHTRFAPIVGGDRRRPAIQRVPIPPTPIIIPTANNLPSLSEEDHLLPSTEASHEDVSLELTMATEVLPSILSPPTAIETVALRRERRRSLVHDGGETITTSVIIQSSTSSPSPLTVSLPDAERRLTMASFLRDSGVGVPMNSTNTANAPSNVSVPSYRTMQSAGALATAVVPQLRIVDGDIVLDDGSSNVSASGGDGSSPTVVVNVVNESGRHLTSHAFVKSIGSNRWSREDTDRFHEAVSMCGTDFAIMALLFPRRSREQIKGKYKVEERTNPSRLAASLARRVPLSRLWLEQARAERVQLAKNAQPQIARVNVPQSANGIRNLDDQGEMQVSLPNGSGLGIHTGDRRSPVPESRRPGRPRQEGGDLLSSLLASPVRSPVSRKSASATPVGSIIIHGIPVEEKILEEGPVRKSPRLTRTRR